MRLHPSLLIVGLLLQAGATSAEQQQRPARRQQQSSRSGASAPQQRPSRGRAANQFPVDAEMLAWVKQNYPSIGQEEQQKQIARVLSEIKKDTGAWYEKDFLPYLKGLAMGGAHKILQYAGAVRSPANIRDASSRFLREALSQKNPAGEYVLPMPPGNPGLLNGFTRPRGGPAAPPDAKPPVPETGNPRPVEEGPSGPGGGQNDPAGRRDRRDGPDEEAIRQFAEMLAKSEDLRKMAAKRLTWFIWENHNGIDFIDKELREGKDKASAPEWRTRTEASLVPWVARRSYYAALLIRFLGVPEADRPQGLAPEVAAHLTGARKNGQPRIQELAGQLIRWTRPSEEKAELEAEDTGTAALAGYPIGPYGTKEPLNWAFAFLKDAQGGAWQLLYGKNLNESIGDAEQNGTDGVPVPGDDGLGDGRRRAPPGAAFGFEDLYGGGDDPLNNKDVFIVSRKGDAPNGGRRISARIVTEELCAPDCKKEGADKRLVEKLALYDISSERELRGVTFALDALPEKTFKFKPGGRDYSVSFDEKGKLVIKGDDDNAVTGNTVDKMMEHRAERARKRSQIVHFGGKEHYVWVEGIGEGGANIYLDKEKVDRVLRGGGDARTLRSEAMAIVNEHVGGQDDIKGEEVFIRARNGDAFKVDGKAYSLKWNGRAFEIQQKPVKDPIQPPKENAGGGNGSGGNGNGTAGSNGTAGGTPAGQGEGETAGPGDGEGGHRVEPGSRDAEGWPIIIDADGQEFPYTRNPAAPLAKAPNVDVKAINAELARRGVEAAIYQLDLDRARPPGQPPKTKATLDNMPIGMWYAAVFKNGDFGAVPFDKAQGPWKQIKEMKAVGTSLATENEHARMYVNLASGLFTQGEERSFDVVALYRDSAAGNNIAEIKNTKPSNQTGLEVLGDVLQKAGFPKANIDQAVGIVGRISKGLGAGEKIGDDTVGVQVPAGADYKIKGGKKDHVLVLDFDPGIDGIATIKLSPKPGVEKGRPSRPEDANTQGGQGTFAFDKPTSGVPWGGWGSPMDIGSDKNAVILNRTTMVPVPQGTAPDDYSVGGARLFVADTKDDKDRPIKRYYLAFTIEQEGAPPLTTQAKPVFESPERTGPVGLKYAPPAELKTIKFGRIVRAKDAPQIGVSNMLSGELIQPFNKDKSQGVYAVFDAPTGPNAKGKNCLGVVMWFGAEDEAVSAAAKAAGCPDPLKK